MFMTSRSREAGLAVGIVLSSFGTMAAQESQTRATSLAHWEGTSFAPDDPPPGLAEPTARAIRDVAPWAQALGYRIDIDGSQEVVYVSRHEGKVLAHELALVRKTHALFEELLPQPERAGETSGIPATTTKRWGAQLFVPDREPVVLVDLDAKAHLDAYLDHVEKEKPHLGGWTRSVRGSTGFVSEATQAGGWLANPAGLEIGTVWRTDHELVHRLACLLLHRRFGELPHWVRTSFGWALEERALGAIYHFPGRDDFTGIDEHEGWEPELKRAFRGRKKKPVQLAEFADWKRGRWDLEQAMLSWGAMRYLLTHRTAELGAWLEAVRVHTKGHSIVTQADGSWQLVPGFTVDVGVQGELMRELVGPDVLTEMSESFRLGKRYKPGR